MIFLLFSILFICIAHIFRVLQWELLINSYESPNRKILIRALSIGYIINYFLPFKIGDLIRAYIAGTKMKNGRGFALATVIIDRCIDVIVVGTIFGILCLKGVKQNTYNSFIDYMLLALILTTTLVFTYLFRDVVKKKIKYISSLFNPYIEERILKFFWSLIWNFHNIVGKISKLRLFCYSILMWTFYISSYYCFALFISNKNMTATWQDIFILLFKKNSLLGSMFITNTSIWYGIYYIMPSILLIFISFIIVDNKKVDIEYTNLLPHVNDNERRSFLETYFSGDRKDYIRNYLDINRDVLVLRDYSAGSNATTILCNNGKSIFFRKYAFGKEADKLYEQILWLQKYQGLFPLPQILNYSKMNEVCFYDMPYNTNYIGLFSYAHSNPYESSWRIMRKALECLENKLYIKSSGFANKETVANYIKDKVNKNVKKITSAKYLKDLLNYKTIFINGKEYKNLPYLLPFIEETKLQRIFKNDIYSDIHGDLTIENIICEKSLNGVDDFYIIDPNTGNIHNSSNLDYAKLLQSIHGNYEFLMATNSVEINNNSIDFTFIKSEVYTYLFKKLDEYMRSNFSIDRVRSIYYHEIVHWLRLLPYKIEKNGKRSLLFYAGLIIVMNDIISWFGEGDER